MPAGLSFHLKPTELEKINFHLFHFHPQNSALEWKHFLPMLSSLLDILWHGTEN